MSEPIINAEIVSETKTPNNAPSGGVGTTRDASARVAGAADDAAKGAGRGAAARAVAANAARSMARSTANAARSGAASVGNWVAKQGGAAALAKRGAMMFATRGLPVVGTVMLAGEVLNLIRNAEPIAHWAPQKGRTLYLPVSGNGHIDTPHGDESSPNSVDSMDAHIDEVNKTSFNFNPDTVWMYCEDGCGDGCDKLTALPLHLNPEAAVASIADWADAVASLHGTLSQFAGEMWADRLLEKYGSNGIADIDGLLERTDDVSQALQVAVQTSEQMGFAAFEALRESIKAARNELQQRAEDEASTWGWVGDMFTNSRGDGALERLQSVTNAVNEAAAQNDDAVAQLNAALEAWISKDSKADTTVAPGQGMPVQKTSKLSDPGAPRQTSPLNTGSGGVGGGGLGSTSENPIEEPKSFMDDLQDKLGTDPFGGGSDPFGGAASPLGGGSDPFGGGASPLGAGGTDPFGSAASPLSNAEDPFAEDEKEPLEDGEDPFAEDEDDTVLDEGEGGFEDEDLDDVIGETDTADDATDEGAPVDGEEAPVTAEATMAPAAAVTPDPNSPEARTVTLPDGRQIEFPDARTAEMVRGLLAADPSAPTSIDKAAADAGFKVNPMGQDIGQMVPPSELKPGDVVVSDAGKGVFIGNGEVLMESQEVKPLADVSAFNGEHQGLFRLEQPDATMAAAAPSDAPAQPVSVDGTEAPVAGGSDTAAAVADAGTVTASGTEAAGTPGMPESSSDTGAVDTSEEGAFGETTETEGLDPNAAAF